MLKSYGNICAKGCMFVTIHSTRLVLVTSNTTLQKCGVREVFVMVLKKVSYDLSPVLHLFDQNYSNYIVKHYYNLK